MFENGSYQRIKVLFYKKSAIDKVQSNTKMVVELCL